jgi:uncharacterized protein YndB with AHSA1/START domain
VAGVAGAWLDGVVTTDPLRLHVHVEAPSDTILRALTDPDLMTEWLAESAEVDLAGSRYEFWGRYTPLGERPRQTLRNAGGPLAFGWDLGVPTDVEIALEPDGDEATAVTVTHTGMPEPHRAELECFWYVTLANLTAQCEERPTMPPFDFSAPAQGAALARTVIDIPAEDVYAGLLDTAVVGRWIGGEATIDAQVGGAYSFGRDTGPLAIVELDPDKTIAYSWRAEDQAETIVRWQLRAVRGATYITLVHDGFADDATAEQYHLSWPTYLVELKRVMELGDRWEPMRG